MAKVIVYMQDTGCVATVHPSGELDIEQVALKDVPYGKPFKIVDESDLPEADYEFFNAWEADMSNPDGTAMGPQRWFISKYDAATVEANTEIAAINAQLVDMPEDNPAFAELQHKLALYGQALADLAAMRKVQTDEVLKLEGVQL